MPSARKKTVAQSKSRKPKRITKRKAAARAKPAQSKAAKPKKASPNIPNIWETARWRRLQAINQQLKALGIEWNLSAHTICISVEGYYGNNDGASVSHSMPLAKGWSAEFVVSNDGGRVMVGAEVALGLDDLLRLIVSKRFRLKTIGWRHLCQFDHNRGNETGWEGSPDSHDITSVDEATIRITSPTGRIFTIDGPEEAVSVTTDGEDAEEAEYDVSCDISVDNGDTDGSDIFAGELTVDISAGAESLRDSFPFEVTIDPWHVKPSDIDDPEESVLTTDLEQQLSAVILEGEALLAAENGR